MVQQVEIVANRSDPEAVACLLFFLPFLYALFHSSIYILEYGTHPAITIVLAIVIFVAFVFAVRKFSLLIWVYGVLATLAMAALAFTFVSGMSDAIWASLAALITMVIGYFVTLGTHKVLG